MSTPEIRFEGFTDDWEQRKLGDLGKARSGIGFPNDEQGGKDGIPFYKVSDMNNAGNEHEMITANNYVTREQIARKGWSVIEEVPAIFFAKVGAAVLLNRKRLCRFPFLLDNNTMAYSIDRSVLNTDFAKTLFETIDLTALIQVGALPSYNAGDVENVNVVIPRMAEQKKIGANFKKLDNLITLHQRKCESLQHLKSAMLVKMFPKQGETKPEIRFEGFTDDWEQRKFKNEVKISNEMVDPKTGLFDELIYIGPGDIEPYTGQLVSEIKTVKESDLISGKFHFYKGDIIYSKIRPELSKCVIAPEDGLASADAYVLHGNENIYQKFLYCILQTRSFYSYSTSVSMRTGMPKINREELGSYDFYAPSIKEQRTIGDFLIGLGNLITLHQRKCESLQHLKSALLHKIFVSK